MIYLAENLKRLRKERRMTQEDVANILSMHRSNYAKIEKGEREVSVTSLVKLSQFFDRSMDDLVLSPDLEKKDVSSFDDSIVGYARILQEMEGESRKIIFEVVDAMMTKQRFKYFLKEELNRKP